MLKERWSDTHIPLLVMSCIPNSHSPRIPCVDVVEALQLGKLNRPWQVKTSCIGLQIDQSSMSSNCCIVTAETMTVIAKCKMFYNIV